MDDSSTGAAGTSQPVLSVQNVSYWYGTKQALDDVSFDVYPGRVTALLGPNGAGKTTLFSLITRLFDAPTGRIEIDGRAASDWGFKVLGPLGVVFQQPTLDLDLSAFDAQGFQFRCLAGRAHKRDDLVPVLAQPSTQVGSGEPRCSGYQVLAHI